MKTCTKCKEEKFIEEFWKQKKSSDGRGCWCKSCSSASLSEWRSKNLEKQRKTERERWRLNSSYRQRKKKTDEKWRRNPKNRFKVVLNKSRSMAKARGYCPCITTEKEIEAAFIGRCHVCGVPEAECDQRLHLDHCHATGTFRGWLCGSCNHAAGLLRDSQEIALSLANYLSGQPQEAEMAAIGRPTG